MRVITTALFALVLAASGASAQPGQGHGNANAKGHDNQRNAHSAKAAKPSNADHGPKASSDHKQAGPPPGHGKQADRGRDAAAPSRKADTGNRGSSTAERVEREIGRVERGLEKRVQVYDERNRDVRYRSSRMDDRFFARHDTREAIGGCPPGLARKRNGCTPPGQAKRHETVFGSYFAPAFFGLSNYDTGRYYYDDGYLLRLGNAGDISGYIPLLGGALTTGSVWPDYYEGYSVPDYYVDYYDLGAPDTYRYADDVIYRIDPGTNAIQSVAALLTGDQFTVGQPMPAGYDVYNVPHPYQSRYYDNPDANYRYSDGYVYQVDPTTKLITAVIDLIA